MKDGWEHGDTSMNDALWTSIFDPTAKKAIQNARNGKYHLAFGRLLGLMMYFEEDENYWLPDSSIDREHRMIPKISNPHFIIILDELLRYFGFCLLLQSFIHSNKPLSCIFDRNHKFE